MVSMPFNSMTFPPLHIANLKSYLNSRQIPADAAYFYLDCARYIGLEFYNFLYKFEIGDFLYSYLLFSEQREKVKGAFLKKLQSDYSREEFVKNFNFFKIIKKLERFHEEILEKTNWGKYCLIGFYCYFQQFIPSLYLSKCIKEKFPLLKTVFAGKTCSFDLGEGILKSFPYVDLTISGEAEETLVELYHSIHGKLEYSDIKGLTYRKKNDVYIKPSRKEIMDLDSLPYPNYDDFFFKLRKWPKHLREEYSDNYYLQVEFARGCWWRKCSFCTYNEPHGAFREKSVTRIIDEITYLIERYNTLQILPEQMIQPRKWQEVLMALKAAHPGLSGLLYLNFKVSGMAKEDFCYLKQYGAKILLGTESFSTRYLQKMNKGITAIENIQALKFCEEYNLVVGHNILYGFPNEEDDDFEDNKKTVEYILHLPPPFDMETLRLTYNSEIFKNPGKFGIQAIIFREEEKLRYPLSILKTFKPFFYNFVSEKPRKYGKKEWESLIKCWRNTYHKPLFSMHLKLQSLLIYQESKNFINIVDRRYESRRNHTLIGEEKDLYLFCDRIQSKEEIYAHFSDMGKSEIESFIEKMCRLKLMFVEDENVLSLAVRIN